MLLILILNASNKEVQLTLKNALFSCLETETDHLVLSHLCDTIGEIGGTLLQATLQIEDKKMIDQINSWPELLTLLMKLF